jgi:uncharacterized protein (TIGR03083 family)
MTPRTADLIAMTWESLDDLLASLSEEEWKAPTDCPGWSVQDNVSHLIDYESRALGRPGPDHQVGELAHVKNPLGAANEIGVDFRRPWPGAKVLEEFREVTAARHAQLDALTDEDLQRETETPIGVRPLSDMLTLRLMDTWSHEQDIRRAVGRPGHLEGPAVDGAVAYFVTMLPFAVGKKAGAPEGSSVVFEVGHRTIPVSVQEGRAKVIDIPFAEPTVRLSMDPGTFAALISGRTTSTDAVTIKGDEDLGAKVLTNLNVMP